MNRRTTAVADLARSWRHGSSQAQSVVLALLLAGVGVSFAVSLAEPDWVPLAAYFVWLLLQMLLLRFQFLVLGATATAVAALVSMVVDAPLEGGRAVAAAFFVLAVVLVMLQGSVQGGGLPMLAGQFVLSDLRDRVQRQGALPDLPEGWQAQSAMLSSRGEDYAGDFMVCDLQGDRLEIILVDVCGKGNAAGPAALQFAGALGGLLGAVPPLEMFHAANRFLARLPEEEQFATAVHLSVDLATGTYEITSAGHPPALRWDAPQHEWVIDGARGTALGVLDEPELHQSQGRLFAGEALMFYTDGVVESRTAQIDAGIEWLQHVARDAVHSGFSGAAERVIEKVEYGEDDRAVLILTRESIPRD